MAEVSVSIVVERVRALIEENKEEDVNFLRGELVSISNVLRAFIQVLYDAEKRSLKERAVEVWLSQLERVCREFEEVLDERDYALVKLKRRRRRRRDYYYNNKPKVRSFFTPASSCLYFTNFGFRYKLAKKIRNVKAQFDLISVERDRYNFVVPEHTAIPTWQVQSTPILQEAVYGRDEEKAILVDTLVTSEHESGLQVLSLVGMGGIGKTTLAQLVYNDTQVKVCFEFKIWIYVSDPFDGVGIAKQIIQGVGKALNTNHLDLVYEQLRDAISGKKFLLFLDDVWTQDRAEWEPLENSLRYGEAGSKILITTRNVRAANMMATIKIFNVGPLYDNDCWSLLRHTAFLGQEKNPIIFELIGRKMAKKCRGLPLMAKMLGGLLRFKSTLEEWESLLQEEEIWDLNSQDYMSHLLLNQNELFPILKLCLSYCSIFPEGSSIEVEKLIEIWTALGYLASSSGSDIGEMKLIGRKYFNILAMQSLFQDFEKSLDGQIKRFKMNQAVYYVAGDLRKKRNMGTKKAPCQVCTPSLVSQVEVYRSLFWDNDSPLTICNCLRSLRVLRIRCKSPSCFPQGVENLINLKWLELSGKKLSREYTKAVCKLNKLQFLRFYVQEIPREIENLVHLTLLDLSFNDSLEELPESICNLHELRTLNIKFCLIWVPVV